MSEILSAIKLKDKVIIISLMVVFAVLLAVGVAAVTQATVDPHVHSYDYHIERGDDGKFDFVGICSDESCDDPRYSVNILSGVIEKTLVTPTCCVKGVKQFSFTYSGATYTLNEDIPVVAHSYVGEVVTENGISSVSASCATEGCTSPALSISGVTEVKLESVTTATCHTPRCESYTFKHNGESFSVLTVIEEDVPHKLNGVYVTEFELYEGVYKYGTEGMTLVGTPILMCGQKTAGYYSCEECDNEIAVMIGKAEHNFVYSENETVLPDATKDGRAIVKCINEECTDSLAITLPKAVEGENAVLVEANHLEKYRKLSYSFVSEEYGFTVDFVFDTVWDEHNFKLLESETVSPSADRNGRAIVACAYEGCTARKTLTLPKIMIGENSTVIIDATELNPTLVSYTYTSEIYGFTIELELAVGSALKHVYTYTLEREGDGFVLVGTCDRPGCQTPVTREENLDLAYADTSTCFRLGEKIWSCIKDGVTYTYSEPATQYAAHNLTYMENETVNPTFDENGRAYIRCTNEGCTRCDELILPKVVVGDNAEVVRTDPELGTKVVKYTFASADYNLNIEINYDVPAHVHDYEYSLEPTSNGAFDLVGICHGWDCDAVEVREEGVETTYVNTSTCTVLGESIWSHVKDGETYYFVLPSFDFAKHNYSYDEEDIIKPDFETDGSLVVACTNEGCSHSIEIALPKVVVGDNAEVVSYDEETGLRILKYTFTYQGLPIELEFRVIDNHTHDYVITLEPHEGKFDLISRCTNELCGDEKRETGVPAVLVEDTTSCTAPGYQIWEYEKEGVTYSCTIIVSVYFGHYMTYEIDADTTVKPTFDSTGSIVVYCKECGEESRTVELPAMVLDENTVFLEETRYEVVYRYTHVTEDDISITLYLTFLK